MSYKDGLNGNDLIAKIKSIMDEAEKYGKKKADQVGTNIGKSLGDGIKDGIDDSKGEIKKSAGELMVEWKKAVKSINNNKTQMKPARIKTILDTAEALKDSEKFGKTVKKQLSGIKATFGDVEVSGLDNVIEKFKTSANELSSIDWGFGKLHDNRKLMQEQVDLGEKLVKSAEQQAKASENAAKIAVDGAEKQVKAQTEVAKAIALTEKQMESAIKRYNKWMSRAGYNHRTVGLGEDDGYTKGWNLRDMVSEACETIENMRDIGEGNGTLSQMRAELNGLQGFINAYEKYIGDMQTTMNHSTLGNKYDNTPKLKEQQKIIDSTTKSLERQGKVYKTISVQKDNAFPKNEHAKKLAVEATTASIEEQVDGMGKLTQLIDELTSKYGKNSFDNIFGSTIADFGTLNASNAIGLYDALIEKENKHIIQLQREARQREVNRRHIEEFVGYFKENQEKITAIPNGLQQYGILVAEISRGALNAKDAIAQLNNEIKKSKAPTVVGISQPTTPKGITADTQPTVVGITQPTTPKGITVEKEITQELEKQSKVLKGVNISSITKGLRFGQDSQKVAQSMIADYLTEYANATSLELKGDTDKAADSYTKAFDMLDKIYDYFNKNATIRDKSYADNSQYTKFLEYIKKYPLQYTDYDKNSFGQSEWKEIVNKYAKGNSPVLTNDSRAMTADQMWGDLTDNFSELFRDNLISNSNAEDKFRHILDMVDEARNKAKDLRKTIDIPIGNDGLQEIGIKIEEATNKTVENVRKAYEIEKNITAEKQSQSLVEDIRAKNTEEALKQIRKAKDNQTSLIDLSGIFNTDDLADELRNMANLAVNKDGYVVDKVKVKDSVAMVKLYNKELETTVYQTYQMKAASEDAASQLAFVGETIEHNVKALRNNKIDIDFEKRFANAQIDNLIQPLKGAKYEGEENLRKLADGIVDAGSLKTFTNELKIAKTEVSTFKKELASDLDTTTKMSNTMLKAAGIIKSYRQEYEKLKDTIGSDILKSQINTMESAFGKYNATNELEEQVKAFNEFDKAKRLYDSNVKSVKASQQEATNVQKSINESWKNVFQNNYKYNNGKTSDDQVALNAMSDFYKKQAQEAKESFDRQEKEAQEFKNNIKSIYTDLISTLQQINTLDSKINDLSLKDGGSGLYSASIQSLQTQKSGLVANMRSITDEINRTVNASANENGMAKFFDVAKQKAILTSAEIEKFDQLLLQADRTGFEFASKVTGKIQPVIEKLQALNKAVSDGAITNPDMIRGIDVMSTTLSSKFNKFKEFGDAASAMDAMNYSDSISQNVTALDKLIQTEAQYFSGQQKYSDKMKFNNLNTLSTDVKNTINEMDDAKTRLSKAMTEFSDGKAIVTGFKQSADGISTINFSILDTATNSMRQFSMATGTADKNLYVVETSITKTAQKMQNAEQQVTKMSTLLHTLGASGFDIVPETAHSDVQRLIDLMNKLNKAARAGDVTKVDELMQDAKLATSEVQKLYNESIKLQNAMDDGTARKIGNYNVGSTVTDFDQLSAAVRRHAADVEGASLKVGKFDEKHNKLNYTLTHGNGNVEHYTASINSLGKTINSQHQGVTKLQSGWKQLGGIISKSAKQMTMAIMGYNVFYQVIAKVRQGVTYIKEIDMAMTELKKVTDETSKSYETFVKNAAANGSKIGATVSDYVNATADFARLGLII